MRPAIPYLTFPGTCEAAMTTYAEVLGGELAHVVRLADAPVDLPADAPGELIFDAELRAGDLVLKASDDPAAEATARASVSVFLTLDGGDQMSEVLTALAEGGSILFPPTDGFGMVEDRFGMRWMATVAAD